LPLQIGFLPLWPSTLGLLDLLGTSTFATEQAPRRSYIDHVLGVQPHNLLKNGNQLISEKKCSLSDLVCIENGFVSVRRNI
jgi:hypothetical protein